QNLRKAASGYDGTAHLDFTYQATGVAVLTGGSVDCPVGPVVATGLTEQRTPNDPNEITGPAGFGPAGYVVPNRVFTYRIDFENDGSAPAQVVTVTQHLDSGLDLDTFQLGDIGFGGLELSVPPGSLPYHTRVDARASLGTFVDVMADLD